MRWRREKRKEWKPFLFQATKKIGQVLGGSGDAGACHQLVNHLVQLGYKVKLNSTSKILIETTGDSVKILIVLPGRSPRALRVRLERSCSRPATSLIGWKPTLNQQITNTHLLFIIVISILLFMISTTHLIVKMMMSR